MIPGEEGLDLIAMCQASNESVKVYCEKHQLPAYYNGAFTGASISCGHRPLIMVIEKLIQDNEHLRLLVNSLMEPVK